MELDLPTAAGMVGVALILAAYLLNQQDWLPSADWRFSLANFAGSALILCSLWTAWNLPAAVIEGAWAAISLYGFLRRIARPRRRRA